MKLKFFLLSVFFCFFAFTASSFALSSSSIATLFNDSSLIPAETKAAMVANINAGKYVADSRGYIYVAPIDLTSFTGVTLYASESGYCKFQYGNGLSIDAKVIKLSDDGSSIAYYYGISTVTPIDYYTNSIICNISGSTNKGGLDLFLAPTGPPQVVAPQQANLEELIQEPSGNLMNHFGVTSTTLLVAGIVIFSLLLVVPLIPRLVRSFL